MADHRNYPLYASPSAGRLFPEEEKPKSSDSSFIRHKVTSADTLINIAVRYNVSVSSLMRCNNLTNSDIWFKSELIIPRSNFPESYEAPSIEVIERAEEFCKVSSLAKATGLDEDAVRERLEKSDGNFDLALKMCSAARDWSSKYDVTLKEAFAYLEMCDQDTDKARQAFIEDMRWENEYRKRNKSPTCCSGILLGNWSGNSVSSVSSQHNLASSQSTRGDWHRLPSGTNFEEDNFSSKKYD